MPLFDFQCNNDKCQTEYFEVLCLFTKLSEVRCPQCETDEVKKLLSVPSVQFTDPSGTSKMDSFSYRAGHYLEKAKGDRRKAQEGSHVGPTPYQDSERVDIGKHDIEHHEGKIT